MGVLERSPFGERLFLSHLLPKPSKPVPQDVRPLEGATVEIFGASSSGTVEGNATGFLKFGPAPQTLSANGKEFSKEIEERPKNRSQK